MTMQITQNARRQHDTREDAERAIEIYYPACYHYVVSEHWIVAGNQEFWSYTVDAYADDGNGDPGKYLGYCYDRDEAIDIAAGSF